MRPHTVLLMGASVRALAWSARRAGFEPIGIDLFGDRDLSAVGTALRIDPARYPRDFEPLASSFSRETPCLYSGALENHPPLVDALARQRPLWGISGEGLRASRDPLQVRSVLREAGLPALAARLDPDGLPRDGSWLQKPLASAGGRRIAAWGPRSARIPEPAYFQVRVRGRNLSAVYLADHGQVQLMGATIQVLGRGGSPFEYRGSCGPIRLESAVLDRFRRVGEVLGDRLGLAGLFGVDTVVQDGEPRVVEINPRYSASVEVLELAEGRSFLTAHARVFDRELADRATRPLENRNGWVVGKLLVDAPGSFRFPDDWEIPESVDLWSVPEVADVPRPGTEFRSGEPVLTVFAVGSEASECLANLHRRWQEWRDRLKAWVAQSAANVEVRRVRR